MTWFNQYLWEYQAAMPGWQVDLQTLQAKVHCTASILRQRSHLHVAASVSACHAVRPCLLLHVMTLPRL